MLEIQPKFTRPESIAANRQGALSKHQRSQILGDMLLVGAGSLLMLTTGVGLLIAGKATFMAALSLLIGAGLLFPIYEDWTIYREPRPNIVVLRGVLQPLPGVPYSKGGMLGIGDQRVYLSRKQLRELRFGVDYEIFVVMPQKTALSANALI